MHDGVVQMGRGEISVVLADDHPIVLTGLEALLREEGDIRVVAAVGDGEAAVDAVLRHRPQVAVLDIRMPGLDGLEAARRIAVEASDTRVIVLSAAEDAGSAVDAFRAGAIGFLPKNAVGQMLVEAIRDAAQGRAVMTPDTVTGLVQALRDELPVANPLAPREKEILQRVAEGHTNEQIAREMGMSISTVKAQLTALFEKLNASDRASALAVCFRHGWLT